MADIVERSGIDRGAESAVRAYAPSSRLDSEAAARGPIVSLRDIRKTFTSASGESIEVLKGVTVDIEAGSFTVIRGESGSGKTSLLRILGMLDSAFEGEYRFAGGDVSAHPDWSIDELRANNIGFIFQDGRLFDHLNVRENIGLPVRLQGTAEERNDLPGSIGKLSPHFFTAAELDGDILSNRPAAVSGGQKQRAAIMRSMINRPAIILADEPTASLDENRKHEVLNLLLDLSKEGHTIIVVSHDKVFYDFGRQLELSGGVLREIDAGDVGISSRLTTRQPGTGRSLLYGWRPRAPLSILLRQSARELLLRKIFLFLILISVGVGICQIGVFASVIIGAQAFLDDAMTKGSRLNRLEVKPKVGDLEKTDRFPAVDEIRSWGNVQAIISRRATLVRLIGLEGKKSVYSAIGLHPDDPEYKLLDFVAGGPFSTGNNELEMIATVGLLPDLFDDTARLADNSLAYADFIGRSVTMELPQFSQTGQELASRAKRIDLKIVGIILHAEGGRRLYLPNTTQLIFDRFKMDRTGEIVLPINEAGNAWTDAGPERAKIADFPWEDQLHVYAREIRDIIPVFQQLSKLGFKPQSDIWNYKWVLDVRDLAWNIFVPLLILIIVAVALTVITNIYTSAKLRERELALWRVLGMRRGDLVATQIISSTLSVFAGGVAGLVLAHGLINWARNFLAQQNPDAGFEMVFAPVSQFFVPALAAAVIIGVLSALRPAVTAARTDPAKVLQS